MKSESTKEKGPLGLQRIHSFSSTQIIQVFMVSPYHEWLLCLLQPMSLLLQRRLDGQQVTVAYIIFPSYIYLQFARRICTGVEPTILRTGLGQGSSNANIRSVHLNHKLLTGIW